MFTKHVTKTQVLHTGAVRANQKQPRSLADVSRLLGETVTIQRGRFYDCGKCQTLCGQRGGEL